MVHEHSSPSSAGNLFLGSKNVVRLVYVEVTPLFMTQSSEDDVPSGGPPRLSCAMVKHFLQTLSIRSTFFWEDNPACPSPARLVLEWIDTEEESIESEDTTTNNKPSPGYLRLEELSSSTHEDGSDAENCSTQRVQNSTKENAKDQVPIFLLPSEDPTSLETIPCCIKGYSDRECDWRLSESQPEALVTSATLVRILPPRVAHPVADLCVDSKITKITPTIGTNHSTKTTSNGWYARECFLQGLAGESSQSELPESLQKEVLENHNPETIQALILRMTLLLSQQIYIGTAADAFTIRQTQQTRSTAMRQALGNFCEGKQHQMKLSQNNTSERDDQNVTFQLEKMAGKSGRLQWEPSLVVHSPNHAAGKTLLIQAVAASNLLPYRPLIHVIPSSSLLPRFGIHADAALESILHGIIMSAAVSPQRCICIILDQLDAMLPPHLSGRSSAGDSAAPVLNATASLLKNMTQSLQRRREMPFPVKNALYNVSGTNGRVLSVRLCLVATVTCPDDGWRASSGDSTGGGSSIFDAIVGGRYRLESLTATTRWSAFRRAFERHQIKLDKDAEEQLPMICASASWVEGSSFERVARRLRVMVASKGLIASVYDVGLSLRTVQGGDAVRFSHVYFQRTSGVEKAKSLGAIQEGITGGDIFHGTVGGNTEAKLSIEDALALDPTRRQILGKFGLSPPTGILLYGPPGCGKTLLAKAIAKLLKTKGGNSVSGRPSSIGGAFISLSSSDIVRAEIGTSEKMVVSAFELARKNAPSVIFIDEFQALFTERSSGGSGRLASTLLQCMDDIKRWRDVDNSAASSGGKSDSGSEENADQAYDNGNHVVVMGATNTPWLVDLAFLRPGRFDRVVHVGLPTELERQLVLLVHVKRMRISSSLDGESVSVLCQSIAGKTKGFSGADLAALCRAAAIRCLHDCGEEGEIEQGHFELALEHDVKPSSSYELVQRLQEWRSR